MSKLVKPGDGFTNLVHAIAEASQPHHMKVSNKRIADHPKMRPAKLIDPKVQRKLHAPNNPMKAPRKFFENEHNPALSKKG